MDRPESRDVVHVAIELGYQHGSAMASRVRRRSSARASRAASAGRRRAPARPPWAGCRAARSGQTGVAALVRCAAAVRGGDGSSGWGLRRGPRGSRSPRRPRSERVSNPFRKRNLQHARDRRVEGGGRGAGPRRSKTGDRTRGRTRRADHIFLGHGHAQLQRPDLRGGSALLPAGPGPREGNPNGRRTGTAAGGRPRRCMGAGPDYCCSSPEVRTQPVLLAPP